MEEKIMPFSSVMLQNLVSTPEMRAVWTEKRMLEKWMEFEKAITEAQAELGMIPEDAAEEILKKCSLEYLKPAHVREVQKTVGHLMVSFIKAFREVCGPAAEHFHLGPTTQDIIDTGLTLQMRDAHGIIMKQLLELEGTLIDQAMKQKDTVMMGRTHQQHAVPVTFGFYLATWASEIRDHIERMKESEKRWMFGNLSSAVGVQNTFVELSDIETAQKLQDMACKKVGLSTPMIDLHTRTDRFAEVITNLSELCSSLGEIGINIRNLQRSEVMEVEEPYRPYEQYSSSTMPNKRNPEPSEQVEGIAIVARGLGLAMQDLQMPDNRDATRMPVEFIAIPLTYMMTSRALNTTTYNIAGLIVHEDNMLKNLDHPNVLGQAAAERLMLSMYKKTGEKVKAHTLLHKCARISQEKRIHFKDVVLENDEVGKHFTPEELDKLLDLTTYTGTAAYQTEKTVEYIKKKRKNDLNKYK